MNQNDVPDHEDEGWFYGLATRSGGGETRWLQVPVYRKGHVLKEEIVVHGQDWEHVHREADVRIRAYKQVYGTGE